MFNTSPWLPSLGCVCHRSGPTSNPKTSLRPPAPSLHYRPRTIPLFSSFLMYFLLNPSLYRCSLHFSIFLLFLVPSRRALNCRCSRLGKLFKTATDCLVSFKTTLPDYLLICCSTCLFIFLSTLLYDVHTYVREYNRSLLAFKKVLLFITLVLYDWF